MTSDSDSKRHPIQVVVRRSGLTAYVLRAWERRYRAVEPGRSTTQRRLYSDADIERLRLLRDATLAGRRIGDIAGLGLEDLEALVGEDRGHPVAPERSGGEPGAERIIVDALAAIQAFDGATLRSLLMRSVMATNLLHFMERVATPLMYEVGARWTRGELAPSHEHLATVVLRHVLVEMMEAVQARDANPTLVVATPAGQPHELGALHVALTAALDGWRIAYLGPDLPAADIARAATHSGAPAVALSITTEEPATAAEIAALRRALPTGIAVLIGGRSVGRNGVSDPAVVRLHDLASLQAVLRRLAAGATAR